MVTARYGVVVTFPGPAQPNGKEIGSPTGGNDPNPVKSPPSNQGGNDGQGDNDNPTTGSTSSSGRCC